MIAHKIVGAHVAQLLIKRRAACDVGKEDRQALDAQAFALRKAIQGKDILAVRAE